MAEEVRDRLCEITQEKAGGILSAYASEKYAGKRTSVHLEPNSADGGVSMAYLLQVWPFGDPMDQWAIFIEKGVVNVDGVVRDAVNFEGNRISSGLCGTGGPENFGPRVGDLLTVHTGVELSDGQYLVLGNPMVGAGIGQVVGDRVEVVSGILLREIRHEDGGNNWTIEHDDNPGEFLLGEIRKAMILCAHGKDPVYPGQDKPLSFHLKRLQDAVLARDMAVIREYGPKGGGGWFPYCNIVEYYLLAVEQGLI